MDFISEGWCKRMRENLESNNLAHQYCRVNLYKKQLKDIYDDVIIYCDDLINENVALLFDDWYKYLFAMEDYYCFNFDFGNNLGAWWECMRYFSSRGFSSVKKDAKKNREPNKKAPIYRDTLYCELYDTYEYKLCMRIFDYLDEKKKLQIKLIEQYVKAIGLYIALKNELKRIEEEAHIDGISLQSPNNATKLSANEAAEQTEAVMLPDDAKAQKNRDEVFTERAMRFFAKAIKKNFMKKVGEGRYEWLFDNGSNVSLGRFLKKVYGRVPALALEKVFGVKNIHQTIYNIDGVKHDWDSQIDELFNDD